MYFIIL